MKSGQKIDPGGTPEDEGTEDQIHGENIHLVLIAHLPPVTILSCPGRGFYRMGTHGGASSYP